MAKSKAKQIEELKKIAKIRVDKERHQLAAMRDETARLENERQGLRKQMRDLTEGRETSAEALMNAYSFLDTLSRKEKQLEARRQEATARTQAQREKIKAALASKIRVDGIDET
ncbi:hypothetical protein [Hyphococcus luteus]|uniref:Flagellar FliJ protein n=1 Tax=Hyphococcus luteus TaxID=2058213 RepID=A0A2S7K8P0_9PROT|nr:hypothetical protein [Marinicaulis flavus]PQA88874.1 hypothetical protein CW354_02630 [Marinicaulis flavus]